MNRSTMTDYVAFNSRGVKLRTFSDITCGRKWVRENAVLHDGLHLREVVVTTHSRKIFTPPKPRADAFAIQPAPRVAPSLEVA